MNNKYLIHHLYWHLLYTKFTTIKEMFQVNLTHVYDNHTLILREH
jgi:hypothetical protein